MSAFLTSMPAVLASALALAFPVPFGQPVVPGSVINPDGEIVDIDQDRAERMTVPVSIEGKGPFASFDFSAADANADGKITKDELAAQRAALENP